MMTNFLDKKFCPILLWNYHILIVAIKTGVEQLWTKYNLTQI